MARTLPKWARVRQLIDGSYVAEVRWGIWPFRWWLGVDRDKDGHLWGRSNYRFCIVQTAEKAIENLASRGISMVDDGKDVSS